ncbi:hypothetical protein D3C85_1526590 [compost metagenome]
MFCLSIDLLASAAIAFTSPSLRVADFTRSVPALSMALRLKACAGAARQAARAATRASCFMCGITVGSKARHSIGIN